MFSLERMLILIASTTEVLGWGDLRWNTYLPEYLFALSKTNIGVYNDNNILLKSRIKLDGFLYECYAEIILHESRRK